MSLTRTQLEAEVTALTNSRPVTLAEFQSVITDVLNNVVVPGDLTGADSVFVDQSALPAVVVSLQGDLDSPGTNMVYGTNDDGSKGWYSASSSSTFAILTIVNGSAQSVGHIEGTNAFWLAPYDDGSIQTYGLAIQPGTVGSGLGGVCFSVANEANTVNGPLEFRATQMQFQCFGGNCNINCGTFTVNGTSINENLPRTIYDSGNSSSAQPLTVSADTGDVYTGSLSGLYRVSYWLWHNTGSATTDKLVFTYGHDGVSDSSHDSGNIAPDAVLSGTFVVWNDNGVRPISWRLNATAGNTYKVYVIVEALGNTVDNS